LRDDDPNYDSAESDSLNRLPDERALVQSFAQALTAFQVAEHCFSQQAFRFVILRPLQLMLAGREVFDYVFEPQKIRLTLAHGNTLCLTEPGGIAFL
jgi:hypothetical protein